MELVQIKITAMVVTSRYGALESGSLLRTDRDYAKHLVEECSAAAWIPADPMVVNDLQSNSPATNVNSQASKKPARQKSIKG